MEIHLAFMGSHRGLAARHPTRLSGLISFDTLFTYTGSLQFMLSCLLRLVPLLFLLQLLPLPPLPSAEAFCRLPVQPHRLDYRALAPVIRRPRILGARISEKMSSQDAYESYNGGDYTVFVGRGMARFRTGRVNDSIADFDRALTLQPRLAPYMWQRGLSLFYADRFEEGSRQFRRDMAVNPNDMEEAIWAFLCDARTEGVGFDAAQMRIPKGGNDRRPYVRAAYALFAGDCDEKELAKQMEAGPPSAIGNKDARESAQSLAAYFYANLYLGLFSEARGDATLAQKYMSAAVRSTYGDSGDYMYDLARVHMLVRGWDD